MRGARSRSAAETSLPIHSGVFEEEAYGRGFAYVAGLDEVGRGPLAGPVVAAAVVLPRGIAHPEIRDSKLLRPRKREELSAWVKEKALVWGLGAAGPDEIDRLNILKASLLAMARALEQLRPAPDCLLIDGPHKIPLEFLEATGERQEEHEILTHALPFQKAITGGDRLCLSIAAASIVAKVERDRMMVDYDARYPEYGFDRHKGYGSPSHLTALRRYGPSPIHRRSFRPVREWPLAISDRQSAVRRNG